MTWTQKWIVAAGAACLLIAVGCAIGGCIPFAAIQPLGERIRRPDDVTPERYQRYLQVCWYFAVGLAGCGVYWLRRRQTAADFLAAIIESARTTTAGITQHLRGIDRLLLLLVTVGAAIRLAFLDQPMAYDESYSYINFASRPIYLAIGDFNSINNHLFNTLLMHLTSRVWGPQEWALRLPVLMFGLLLLPACWFWARSWLGKEHAWLVVAFASVSPMLITYSVDARGYMYLTLCTVLLDHALARIRLKPGHAQSSWLWAWCAVVVGFWSLLLMVYPIAGVFASFLVLMMRRPAADSSEPAIDVMTSGDVDSGGAPSGEMDSSEMASSNTNVPTANSVPQANTAGHSRRVLLGDVVRLGQQLLVFGWVASVGAAVLYAPAYVFRGFEFMDNPTLHQLDFASYSAGFARMWVNAFNWWSDGPIPQVLWLLFATIGLLMVLRSPGDRLRLLLPFVAAGLLTMLQRVTPAPRMLMFLTPFFYLLVAHGIVATCDRLPPGLRFVRCIAIAIVISGIVSAALRPVLFDPAERAGYRSIPAVIQRIDKEMQEPAATANQRLIAPLPCDLPSLFYMDRNGFRIPVNGEPMLGETVWLITRHGESPQDVLSSSLVDLSAWVDRFEAWERVDQYETLVLYRSKLRGRGD